MVATASTLNTGTIFQFSNFMTSSSAGIFAGSNEIKRIGVPPNNAAR
jgi:hypothetical protein